MRNLDNAFIKGGFVSSNDELKLSANYKKKQEMRPESTLEKYEKAIDEFKKLLQDKVHAENQTAAYKKNVTTIINRLLVAADELDAEEPGKGIFGLIVVALSSTLNLKDKLLNLEVKNRELEIRLKRLEKK